MPSRVHLTRTTAAERRWLVGIAVAALVAFVALAVWAHDNVTQAWEQQLVDQLAVGDNLLGDIVVTLNTAGNLYNWAAVVAIAAVAVGVVRGVRAGVFVGASFLVDFMATLAKVWVERGRPDTVAAHLLFGVDAYGFPSGHTARVAAVTGALVWVFVPVRWRLPAATIGAIIGGLVMAYARISLGVHFPTDTLGGILLGVAWFAATAALI
jgi:membrane-associated phospholipid phosphatase